MKIYTRTGDAGDTALFGGKRVPKDDLRVTAYGTVDEANALLGLARAELERELPPSSTQPDAQSGGDLPTLDDELASLQSLLFDLGADLATPSDARQRSFIRPVDEHDVERIEELIDLYSQELPELTKFILPGGSASAAALQATRAVIRRAERDTVALARVDEIGSYVLPLINRLSDLFFTLARVANHRAGSAEVVWEARKPPRGRKQ